jgi:hypothetical protein
MNVVIGLSLAALTAAGGWFGYPYLQDYLRRQSYFNVERVTFRGLERVREEELRSVLEGPPPVVGSNLFALQLEELQKKLERHPWIESAVLHRRLPDHLFIEISERKPVALFSTDGLWALDVRGVALPLDVDRGVLDLPIVNFRGDRDGLPQIRSFQGGDTLRDVRLIELLGKLEALRRRLPPLWEAFSEITLTEEGDVEAFAFRQSAKVLLGGSPGWRQMLNFYTFIIYQGRRAGIADIELVDLRFRNQVVVRRTTAKTDTTDQASSKGPLSTAFPRKKPFNYL